VTALLASDPKAAAAQARTLAAADPGNPQAQGLYLAALYQSRNAWDFDRALSRAMASGVTVKKMLNASAPFHAALAQEMKLRKATPPAGLLSEDTLQKMNSSL
jgi:hypothetical protein